MQNISGLSRSYGDLVLALKSAQGNNVQERRVETGLMVLARGMVFALMVLKKKTGCCWLKGFW